MAGTTLCPSAAALARAIVEARPDLSREVSDLAKAHIDFIGALGAFGPRTRDLALAATHAEQALAWALKGIADEALLSTSAS